MKKLQYFYKKHCNFKNYRLVLIPTIPPSPPPKRESITIIPVFKVREMLGLTQKLTPIVMVA